MVDVSMALPSLERRESLHGFPTGDYHYLFETLRYFSNQLQIEKESHSLNIFLISI
jgi:hypothetical protein